MITIRMPDSKSQSRAALPPGTGYPREWSPVRAVYAVLTGSLLVLAFPLYGDRYHLDHLVWLLFVPLFLAAQGVGPRRGFFLGWLAGMTLEAAGFLWILYAIRRFGDSGAVTSSLMFAGWVAYSSVPWALLGLALGRCRRPAQGVFANVLTPV